MTGNNFRSWLILGGGIFAGWITCVAILIQNMGTI